MTGDASGLWAVGSSGEGEGKTVSSAWLRRSASSWPTAIRGAALDELRRRKREATLRGLDITGLRGAEIGPLNRPLVSKSESEVYYVDHCSAEQLREKYHGDPNVNPNDIVDVDFIWSDKPAKELLGSVYPLDYVVASHVIEHVPDLIG